MEESVLIQQLFKTEYRKIISVLCKLFGIEHLDMAEDITNDTFLLATETWGVKGIPDNPTAWLYTVAKNKTKDYFKRRKIFREKIVVDFNHNSTDFDEIDIDLSSQNISESQLLMMFAVCNPVIAKVAQIGLALRILCGFGIDEIAEAFLTNKETINKRFFRAKEKLRTENVKIEMPHETDISQRLDMVLATIYVLFTEGYYSTTQNISLRKDLCLEAMRLNYLLLENDKTNQPITNALMSLMCFHASRFDARTSETGESILYDSQNRDLWHDELIDKGNYFLIESAKGQEVSKYHLEASIAYLHCTKIEPPNKWENILQLYNKLLLIDYSPMAALNRTYALAKANGKPIAIKEAEKLNLTNNHLYFVLLGNLYTDFDNTIAIKHYQTALTLVKTTHDKGVIENYIRKIL
jgi:RNA polymerase sigma factor (sigma-70 family)